MYKILITILIYITSVSSFAVEVSPLLGANYASGGDTLVTVLYTDGSTSELKGGRGITLLGGAVFEDIWSTGNHYIDGQTTLGLKYGSTKAAENGSVTIKRWPLEAMLFYRNKELSFRAGLGVSYHLSNKVSGTDVVSGISVDIDNALGGVIQGDYLFGSQKHMALGLRYESISYEISGVNYSVNGDSVGVQFIYMIKDN